MQLPEALKPLAVFNQFLLSKTVDGVKYPCDINGNVCDAHNPMNWLPAATALETAKQTGMHVAFVFTDNDPFFFVDVDNCLSGGKWSERAVELMTRFNGSAVEISQSGTGLHIIGTGIPSLKSDQRRKKSICEEFDLYTTLRYVALTGNGIVGNAGHVVNQQQLDYVVSTYLNKSTSPTALQWTTRPVDEWCGPEDDEELIKKARKSKPPKAIFGQKASFSQLYDCDIEALSQIFPRDNGYGVDMSRADAALAQHLAFWTGKDCGRILRIMHTSGLCREKYNRVEYLQRTIMEAVALQKNVYKSRSTPQAAAEIKNPLTLVPEIVDGFQYLDGTRQAQYFAGCTYVMETNCIFIPSGWSLKQEVFNALYGGYEFQLTSEGKTTRKAWEAFTNSQVVRFPKVETCCFKPSDPPGSLLYDNGHTSVNIYVPLQTKRVVGDPTPFLLHLNKVLPDNNDRLIFLSYMAACVQHKGVKFQWAPLLQGVEGNGKTLFTRCVAYAIGDKYVHFPPASEISEKFNSWLFNTLFIGVEDIYLANASDVLEIIKPMITSTKMACRAMRTDQVMKDVTCNFIFNSNHRDAILKTRNDRRFSIFYSAQQEFEDLARDGMGKDYFKNLYDWLQEDQGYAIVNEYLSNFAIPEAYNPATGCRNRAPITSTTAQAIRDSMDAVGQDIAEAIAQGRPGFCGGWVSSMALDRLLKNNNHRVSHSRRRLLLKQLGYEPHPSLPDGRTPTVIPCDNGKPRLYVIPGSPNALLKERAKVCIAYENAQTLELGTDVQVLVDRLPQKSNGPL